MSPILRVLIRNAGDLPNYHCMNLHVGISEDIFPNPRSNKRHLCLKLFNFSYFGTYSILYLAVLENKEESGTIDVRVGNLGILEFKTNNF